MFTGLIREIATVESFANNSLKIKAKYSPKLGDSIAINGACLTVVSFDSNSFSVELSQESMNLLALENYSNKVHIEPAMQLGDRVEGHMVQGHVDCIGQIQKIDKNSKGWDVYIKIPKEFSKLIIPKGSVAIDGVSLTINDVKDNTFRLTIIPHTINNTLFKDWKISQRVNVETDMFARYLYHMFNKNSNLTWDDISKIHALW